MIRHLCQKCEHEVSRVVIDLGKEKGEEGHDFLVVYRCPEHGDFKNPRTVDECDHCGRRDGLYGRIMDGMDEQYPVTVCSDACFAALEPPPIVFHRSDFIEFIYKAGPARNGKIYRLRCLCGELPDGQHYMAAKCDCSAYRCATCLPRD